MQFCVAKRTTSELIDDAVSGISNFRCCIPSIIIRRLNKAQGCKVTEYRRPEIDLA